MKQIVLGTAGHIDHGKTAFIKALTGVDTDRLKEEKERGITIELGFASLTLPSGIQIGIVDVPGHEKFVKNMVAGAWGIDIVALIVAADEGIMPQTREHLDICRLLNVRRGLVIITKIDLADEELTELVEQEVREFIAGTFLDGQRIVRVSSVTGQGIPEVVEALDSLAQETEERPSTGVFRLPIDRVFVMKGFGTVVTGTLVSGRVRLGDPVQVLPSGHETKVRAIQLHNQPVEEASAGQRTALNLQGLEKAMIRRGEVVCHPGTLEATQILDGQLDHLASSPRSLRNRVQQRFHIGTSLVPARITLLDREELKPGEKGMAQFRLEFPVVALPMDRFVIRGSSAVQTLGGGVVLNNHPLRHRRSDSGVIQDLILLRDGPLKDVITYHVHQSGYGGLSAQELWTRIGNVSRDQMQSALEMLIAGGEIIGVGSEGTRYIHHELYETLKRDVARYLTDFHAKTPMALGLSKEELKTKLPKTMGPRLFQRVLQEMAVVKHVVVEGEKIRLSSHEVSVQEDVLQKVENTIRMGALTPPSFKDMVEQFGMEADELRSLLELLVNRRVVSRLKGDLYFHREAVSRLKEAVLEFIRAEGEMSTSQFKDLTGISRKFAIPLLEHLDNIKVTMRVGDKRILRGRSE